MRLAATHRRYGFRAASVHGVALPFEFGDAGAIGVERRIGKGPVDLGLALVELRNLAFDPRDLRLELRLHFERGELRGLRARRRGRIRLELVTLARALQGLVGVVSAFGLTPRAAVDPEHAIAEP